MEKVPSDVRSGTETIGERPLAATRAAEYAWRPGGLSMSAGGAAEELTFVDALTVILQNRRLIVILPLVLVIGTLAAVLTAPRQYTAVASFMPRASDASRLAGLGGLAAQIGVNIPAGDPGQSSDFYADLVLSREILSALLESRYHVANPRDTASRTLIQLFDAGGETPAERRDEAIKELTRRLGVSKNLKTGVVEVRARTEWPEVSQQLAARVLELVNDFNLRQRQQKALADRQFTEDRLRTIRTELYDAEEAVAEFGRRNHAYRGSPDLSTEYDRLSRAVTMRQQLFTSFSQLYEQARIDALRNTPLIMIVDHPELAARPDSRRAVLKLTLALVAGVLIALMIAFSRELLSVDRVSSSRGYARFAALRAEARADLRHPLRALLRGKAARA